MVGGFHSSEAFLRDLSDKEFRDEYVADQIRTRIALLVRALREQTDRGWSQMKLGHEMGKPQSVISRIEDPEYGKLSVQTLLEVAAAFDLPLWVDIPEWDDWLRMIKDVPNSKTTRSSYDAEKIIRKQYEETQTYCVNTNVVSIRSIRQKPATGSDGNLTCAKLFSVTESYSNAMEA